MHKKLNILIFFFGLLGAFQSSFAAQQCQLSNDWYLPAKALAGTQQQIFSQLPKTGILLLGEHHANTAHHVWQLEVIKAAYQQQKKLILGLEMMPRSAQATLDAWVDSKIDRETFLQQSKWLHYWSDNFDDYFPILEFAQQNHIPLVALNVSQELLQGVSTVGWEGVPPDHREGVGDPAAPGKDYIQKIARSFTRHLTPGAPIDKEAFKRFYQQQLIWDRAMAEALHKTAQQNQDHLLIGLMGSWHIIDKEGVPYQLADLGIKQVTTLVPWSEHINCSSLTPTFADAVYGLTVQQ
ncbi:MAG: ChaN family lipoprotein [Gammaproteobacteria bacterium]|nr:ChaN family lipoprotein [Gammaproteobacteria bacterium]